MKLTNSEAGKLGYLKSKQITKLKIQSQIETYYLNPILCKNCNQSLNYKQRKNKFCSISCATTYNNLRRPRRAQLKTYICKNCGNIYKHYNWNIRIYCNNKCQGEYESKLRLNKWLNEGIGWLGQIPSWAKNYLIKQRGYQCEECKITEWNNKPILLECDHIDGNHKNNTLENLRLLCPNCHSQTPTFKNKNRGKGRISRRNLLINTKNK